MADCSEKTYRNAESHKLTKVNTGTSPYPPRKPGGLAAWIHDTYIDQSGRKC